MVVNGALLDPKKYELERFGSENKDGTINYGFFEQAKDKKNKSSIIKKLLNIFDKTLFYQNI